MIKQIGCNSTATEQIRYGDLQESKLDVLQIFQGWESGWNNKKIKPDSTVVVVGRNNEGQEMREQVADLIVVVKANCGSHHQ